MFNLLLADPHLRVQLMLPVSQESLRYSQEASPGNDQGDFRQIVITDGIKYRRVVELVSRRERMGQTVSKGMQRAVQIRTAYMHFWQTARWCL